MRRIEAAWASAIVLACAAAVAHACWYGASWQLLDNRDATLHAPPANSFAWEAAHLAPASAWAHARPAADQSGETVDPRERAERGGLNPAQLAALATMRAAPDSRWALSAAGALPEAIRLYTGGAVAFQHGNLADAREYFSFVLRLPAERAAPRVAWAQYMLARVAQASGQPAEAETAFAAVRDRVAHGAPDPLGLAVASLGEQARLRLDRGDVPGAVALYAEQAADGSDEAVQSLRIVAERITRTPERLPALVHDALVQRLLVVHALGLTGDYLHRLWIGGVEGGIGADGFFPPDGLDLKPLSGLLAAIRAGGVPVAEPDRLAALAYRLGQTDAARDLSHSASTPLALWVRAKLALESGGLDRAAPLFARALHAAESDARAASIEPSGVGQLRGETSVATLSRGDFVQAAEVMWPVAHTYWGDFAYLAERVLTADELRAFVATHAAAPKPGIDDQADPVNGIRALLARRLMRDGRVEDALPYFDPPPSPQDRAIRQDAAAYGDALGQSLHAFWATDRARAAWRAAVLLRTRGMELMGTEEGPDQAYTRGLSAYFIGPGSAGPFAGAQGLATTPERVRFDASRPRPDLRYHYRYLAVEQAISAARDLPARSQAYAAVLCRAAHWSLGVGDTTRATSIWHQYTAHGAVVAFAAHFGQACPEPDFGGLWHTRGRLAEQVARHALHGRKWLVAGVAAGASVLGALLLRRRRINA